MTVSVDEEDVGGATTSGTTTSGTTTSCDDACDEAGDDAACDSCVVGTLGLFDRIGGLLLLLLLLGLPLLLLLKLVRWYVAMLGGIGSLAEITVSKLLAVTLRKKLDHAFVSLLGCLVRHILTSFNNSTQPGTNVVEYISAAFSCTVAVAKPLSSRTRNSITPLR